MRQRYAVVVLVAAMVVGDARGAWRAGPRVAADPA